jgi:hypothetical protein
MCNFQSVLRPDQKLTNMLTMVKIILIINLISSFLRLFINPGDMISDLICVFFLFAAYNTIYFIYMALYLIFSLMNTVYITINTGIVLQMLIQGTLQGSKSKILLLFGISLYLLIFYIFAIISNYGVYKEMKAQLMESFGGLGPTERLNQNRDEQAPVVNNNNSSYRPFAGQGVAVGGR